MDENTRGVVVQITDRFVIIQPDGEVGEDTLYYEWNGSPSIRPLVRPLNAAELLSEV